MSEAEKSAEIEDVLSSIRRLVADGPRVDQNKPQALNLAASRIEPPLTASKDIDEAMEEHPIEENTVLELESFIPEEDLLVTSEETIQPLPEVETPDADGPITFVQAINASIAEMAKSNEAAEVTEAPEIEEIVTEAVSETEHTVEEIATLPEDADTEARAAHVNAFLANETSMPSELDQSAPEKAEPFVLRPEMAATPEENPEVEDIREDVVTTQDSIEDDPFEYTADDLDELELPEDISDDEIVTAAEEPAGDTFIDEETLREIVSELVRAELQGDLGDRITRNVRKLVRREIHHALASREIP